MRHFFLFFPEHIHTKYDEINSSKVLGANAKLNLKGVWWGRGAVYVCVSERLKTRFRLRILSLKGAEAVMTIWG